MLEKFLRLTAWTMTAPTAFSFFHIIIAVSGTLVAFLAANVCSHYSDRYCSDRLCSNRYHSDQAAVIRPERILFFCGALLLLMECYKQAFLYVVVNHGHYDWWYFPFQLCSVPMYLCLLYPMLPETGCAAGTRRTAATFLQDFGMLGGMMALLFPEGFLTPWWTLTLHGFLWHFILIFLAVYCRKAGLTDLSERGFVRTLPLYLLCCLIAAAINTAVQYNFYPDSYADLFYINCFFPSEQPVFREISLALGNLWGHAAYLLTSCIGAGLIHQASARLTRSPNRDHHHA